MDSFLIMNISNLNTFWTTFDANNCWYIIYNSHTDDPRFLGSRICSWPEENCVFSPESGLALRREEPSLCGCCSTGSEEPISAWPGCQTLLWGQRLLEGRRDLQGCSGCLMPLAAPLGTAPAGLVAEPCTGMKTCSVSAGSIPVLADPPGLGQGIIYSSQQGPDGGWWRIRAALLFVTELLQPWALQGTPGCSLWGEVCFGQNNAFPAAKIMFLLLWLWGGTSCPQMGLGSGFHISSQR